MQNIVKFDLFEKEVDPDFKPKKLINGKMDFKKVPLFDDVADNRDKAEVGDTVFAIWYPDNNWYKFKAEKLTEGGLGFSDGETTYELESAYHAIVLK